MADSSGETPPPIGNTKRPTLQERAARRNKTPSVKWALFKLGFTVAATIGGMYFLQYLFTKPGEPVRSPFAVVLGLPNGAAQEPAKAASITPKAEPEDLDAIQRRMELETAHGIERQQLAAAKLKQRQAVALGESVYRVLDEWKAELEQWSKEVVPLSRNDQGKALAANSSLLRQYRAVIATERPGRDEAKRVKEEVEGLVSVMKTASENPSDGSLPGTEITEGLQGLLKEAKAGRGKSREAREQVASLVTQAADEGSKGDVTLAEAAQKQRDEERRASAAVIEAERSKAEEEATRTIATAKAEQARVLGEKQEKLIKAETAALAAKKERERVQKLAADPAIQDQFSPFLALGKFQYVSYGTPSDVPEPASYTTLAEKGHLNDEKAFARVMAGYGAPASGGAVLIGNDRPHKPYPTTQAGMKRMGELLELFKELAPVWVEKGMLRP